MSLSDTARKALFALSLALVVAWVIGMTTVVSSDEPGIAGRATGGRVDPPAIGTGFQGSGPAQTVGDIGMAFVAAYLRYQEGVSTDRHRLALAGLSTPSFGRQLLRQPVRLPAGAQPVREWVSRVAEIHVGIFGGEPALLVSVVVAGPNGAHVLTPTLLERDGRWLVAGVGA